VRFSLAISAFPEDVRREFGKIISDLLESLLSLRLEFEVIYGAVLYLLKSP